MIALQFSVFSFPAAFGESLVANRKTENWQTARSVARQGGPNAAPGACSTPFDGPYHPRPRRAAPEAGSRANAGHPAPLQSNPIHLAAPVWLPDLCAKA